MDHMQIICTSLQTDNHANISPFNFRGRMPFLPPNQQRQSTESRVINEWNILSDHNDCTSHCILEEATNWLSWECRILQIKKICINLHHATELALNTPENTGHTKRWQEDAADDGTARLVIRLMARHRASLITAGAILSSVPSCLQRTKTSTMQFIYAYDTSPIQLETLCSIHSSWMAWTSAHDVL